MSIETADVVIVGGGVMGVSIAHHLAGARCGKVVVLEKNHVGAGSSGKSGAIIRQHYSTDLLVQMARHGVLTFRDFAAHTEAASGWDNAGCLIVASERDRPAVSRNVQLMQNAGAQAEICSGERLSSIAPTARFDPDEIAAWEPEAGYVDAAEVLHGYANSATRNGADIRCGVQVLNVELYRSMVTAVDTDTGRIESRTVVLCAGPWAGRLAGRAGIELPLTVVRPQVAFFRRPGDFGASSHPVIADVSRGFYCRPDPGGRTLVGALDISGDEVINNPDDYEQGASTDFIRWADSTVSGRMPAMQRSFGRGGYSGLYTLTPDSHPMLGEAPAARGLYLAVGFSGHGFKLSPAVGRGIAELIASGGYQSLDLSPLRPTRFMEGAPISSAYEYGLLS